MQTHPIIEDLNKLLAKTYLAHDTLIDYCQKVEKSEVRECLQDLIEILRSHEDSLEMRRFLNGNPDEHISFKMMLAKGLEKLKLLAIDSDDEIIDKSITAMEMGIQACNDFLAKQEEAKDISLDIVKQIRLDYAQMDKQLHSLQ